MRYKMIKKFLKIFINGLRKKLGKEKKTKLPFSNLEDVFAYT